MSTSTEAWLSSGGHLPEFMRDFHDQKDLFKSLFERQKPNEIDALRDLNWVAAHVFTVDCFLWFMARRGYTLQRTRRKGDYRDIEADITSDSDERTKHFVSLIPFAQEQPK